MNQRNISLKLKLFSPNISSIKKGRESILNNIVDSILDDNEIGFAGYLNRKDLRKDLETFIFGTSKEINLPDLETKKKEIFQTIKDVIKKCHNYTTIPALNIFVFPTQDPNVIKEMGGINGFTPYKKTLHLYVNSNANVDWLRHLSYTVAHEITHVISREKFGWHTILDSLIFEGLAEHFRENILNGEKAPWVNAISKERVKSILKELESENLLQSISNHIYIDLFFGGKKFSKWSGYTIGYSIIEKILKSGKFELKKLLHKEPTKIFIIYKTMTR